MFVWQLRPFHYPNLARTKLTYPQCAVMNDKVLWVFHLADKRPIFPYRVTIH
jgi:hypothetical protein